MSIGGLVVGEATGPPPKYSFPLYGAASILASLAAPAARTAAAASIIPKPRNTL
jgi:hypothetical protein